jgi:hypothetical protein
MKKWLANNPSLSRYLPLVPPFPKEICFQYVAFRSTQKKQGRIACRGTLNGITRMLSYEGYEKHGHPVPPEFPPFFFF